eukprot:snap_masked-scaffold_103-processed-gene-0.11-mRNA-1 protein AED:1.00 eAED:1.00 QI:0/-1/0/0/-1/1/1/0/143
MLSTDRVLPKEDDTIENENPNEEIAEENEAEVQKLDIGATFEDEEEVQPIHLDSFIMVFNISSNITSIHLTKCSCRFEQECFQSLLDSGATQHVVGNKSSLKKTEPVHNISISGAFSKKIINSVKGRLDHILLNNVVLQLVVY